MRKAQPPLFLTNATLINGAQQQRHVKNLQKKSLATSHSNIPCAICGVKHVGNFAALLKEVAGGELLGHSGAGNTAAGLLGVGFAGKGLAAGVVDSLVGFLKRNFAGSAHNVTELRAGHLAAGCP